MTTPRRIALALITLAGVIVLAPGTASASSSSPDAQPFGQHVRHCTQTIGFSGQHNPGMHQGNAGWDGMPCHE